MYVHECFAYKREALEIAIKPCEEDWTLAFKLGGKTVMSATLNEEQLRSAKLALDAHFAFREDDFHCQYCGNLIEDPGAKCPSCGNVQPGQEELPFEPDYEEAI